MEQRQKIYKDPLHINILSYKKDTSGIMTEREDISILSWKQRHIGSIRAVSILLSIIFLDQQAGWAQGGKPVWAQAKPAEFVQHDMYPSKYKVPYDLAKTQETVMNGGDEVIFNIQDAHPSLSAQYSIAGLLETLVTDYDLEFIALEGASGYIDTSLLSTFPDKRIRKDTADFLMREGRMSAGEFFAITTDAENISLYGIEDDKLYRENIESFRTLAADRAGKTGNITALLEQLGALGEKVWNKDLKKLNDLSSEHREKKLSFSDYWTAVKELTAKHGINTASYPEISKLIRSIELEKEIDFQKANTERGQLIDELSRDRDKEMLEVLVLKSLAFKQNKISQADYHSYLVDLAKKEGISADAYSNMILFTNYVTIYESVEIMELYREIDALEEDMRTKLYRDPSERELFGMIRLAQLLKQLYAMELNNPESEYLMTNKKNFSAKKYAEFIKTNCRKYGVEIAGGYDLADIENGIDGALEFYYDAKARDNAMLANTVKKMREEGKKTSALITGGYHTEGLTGIMKEQGLSYLVIVPKYQSGEERPYIAVLTNKKKPYEELLESGRYKLAVAAYLYDYKGDLAGIKSMVFHALGEAMIDGRDVEKIKAEWSSGYKAAYENLSEAHRLAMDFTPPAPDEFSAYLEKIKIRKVNDGSAVIEDMTTDAGHGVFISIVRKKDASGKDFYDFNPASKEERTRFLARRGEEGEFRTVLTELKEEVKKAQALKDELSTITKELGKRISREEGLEKIKEIAADKVLRERIAEKIHDAGREIDQEEIVRTLRTLGCRIPRDWEDSPEVMQQLDIIVSTTKFMSFGIEMIPSEHVNLEEGWKEVIFYFRPGVQEKIASIIKTDLETGEIITLTEYYRSGLIKRIQDEFGSIWEYDENVVAEGADRGRCILEFLPDTGEYSTYQWQHRKVIKNTYDGSYQVEPGTPVFSGVREDQRRISISKKAVDGDVTPGEPVVKSIKEERSDGRQKKLEPTDVFKKEDGTSIVPVIATIASISVGFLFTYSVVFGWMGIPIVLGMSLLLIKNVGKKTGWFDAIPFINRVVYKPLYPYIGIFLILSGLIMGFSGRSADPAKPKPPITAKAPVSAVQLATDDIMIDMPRRGAAAAEDTADTAIKKAVKDYFFGIEIALLKFKVEQGLPIYYGNSTNPCVLKTLASIRHRKFILDGVSDSYGMPERRLEDLSLEIDKALEKIDPKDIPPYIMKQPKKLRNAFLLVRAFDRKTYDDKLAGCDRGIRGKDLGKTWGFTTGNRYWGHVAEGKRGVLITVNQEMNTIKAAAAIVHEAWHPWPENIKEAVIKSFKGLAEIWTLFGNTRAYEEQPAYKKLNAFLLNVAALDVEWEWAGFFDREDKKNSVLLGIILLGSGIFIPLTLFFVARRVIKLIAGTDKEAKGKLKPKVKKISPKEEPVGIIPLITTVSLSVAALCGVISLPLVAVGTVGVGASYFVYKYAGLHSILKTPLNNENISDIERLRLQKQCGDILGERYNVEVIGDTEWHVDLLSVIEQIAGKIDTKNLTTKEFRNVIISALKQMYPTPQVKWLIDELEGMDLGKYITKKEIHSFMVETDASDLNMDALRDRMYEESIPQLFPSPHASVNFIRPTLLAPEQAQGKKQYQVTVVADDIMDARQKAGLLSEITGIGKEIAEEYTGMEYAFTEEKTIYVRERTAKAPNAARVLVLMHEKAEANLNKAPPGTLSALLLNGEIWANIGEVYNVIIYTIKKLLTPLAVSRVISLKETLRKEDETGIFTDEWLSSLKEMAVTNAMSKGSV
ncbi:MAG: hypothetical protein KKG84_00405, partial [Candidatus Omnitrophica bacterium]|nr:hypothetical protein [Candidatus Omnitrophota bacterium]